MFLPEVIGISDPGSGVIAPFGGLALRIEGKPVRRQAVKYRSASLRLRYVEQEVPEASLARVIGPAFSGWSRQSWQAPGRSTLSLGAPLACDGAMELRSSIAREGACRERAVL